MIHNVLNIQRRTYYNNINNNNNHNTNNGNKRVMNPAVYLTHYD